MHVRANTEREKERDEEKESEREIEIEWEKEGERDAEQAIKNLGYKLSTRLHANYLRQQAF